MILFSFITPFAYCQNIQDSISSETTRNHQIELRHDNDFLQFTDKYYTTGNFISYRWLLKNKKYKKQNSIFLSQEIYTPSLIEETDISKFDRPYGGFLAINFEHTITGKDWIFDFIYSFGVTGEISGGEWLQNLFHSTAATDSRIASWVGQIENNFTNNCYFKYLKEWELHTDPFNVYFAIAPSAAVGIKEVYFQNDILFFIGKRNSMQLTSAYHQLGVLKNEFFLGINAGYRYVAHNTMLEGNLIGDNSIFLVDALNHLLFMSTDIHLRRGRSDIKLSYKFMSAETKTTESHLYVSLSLARNF